MIQFLLNWLTPGRIIVRSASLSLLSSMPIVSPDLLFSDIVMLGRIVLPFCLDGFDLLNCFIPLI